MTSSSDSTYHAIDSIGHLNKSGEFPVRSIQECTKVRIRIRLGLLVLLLFSLLLDVPELKAQENQIRVLDVEQFSVDGGSGPDWGPYDLIVYHFLDASENFQIATVKPDGSDKRCLSCDIAQGPRVDRHKGGANWHPSGDYIVFLAEMDHHAMDDEPLGRTSAMPGRSWWTNLWITTADGSEWYQLTDYYTGLDLETGRMEGAFYPHFSHDGTKLFWAKFYKVSDESDPVGYNQLLLADFVVEQDGEPRLLNIRDITPPGIKQHHFFEPLGFSPDDKKVLFASNMNEEHGLAFDLLRMDLETGNLEDLTETNDVWNEHARYSPSGQYISWMSSWNYYYNPSLPGLLPLDTLKTDLFVMHEDGSNVVQITHFNTPGYEEYLSQKTIAGGNSWSPDGMRIIVSRNYPTADLTEIPDYEMWMVTLIYNQSSSSENDGGGGGGCFIATASLGPLWQKQ